MRRFLLILIIIEVSLMFGAQFEIVSDAKENPMHMGLFDLDDIQKLDDNGKVGALVIVNCGLEDVFFQSLYGKIHQTGRSGQYRIVLKERTQYFVIQKKGFGDHKYIFPRPLKSGTVYEMTVDEKIKKPEVGMIAITSNENDASVYINNEFKGKIEKKIFTGLAPLGEQEIEIRKSGFITIKTIHNITPEGSRIEMNLEPEIPAAVTITTDPQGAKVFINDILFGLTPKNHFFNAGTYPIRIEKEGYSTINEQITITEPETKKHYLLTDNMATLTINTLNSATIKLNNKTYQSVENLRLSPAVIKIEISHPQAQTVSRIVTLEKNQNLELDLFPDIDRGSIVVAVIPSTAKIELKGYSGEYFTSNGRNNFSDIPIGTYQLLVSDDGFLSHQEIINLTADQTIQKQISLQKETYSNQSPLTNNVESNSSKSITTSSDYYNRLQTGFNGFSYKMTYDDVDYEESQDYQQIQMRYEVNNSYNRNKNFSLVSYIFWEEGSIDASFLDGYNTENIGLYFNPIFKNIIYRIKPDNSIFYSLEFPISRTYIYDDNDYNYNTLNMAINVSLGLENMSYYIRQKSLWNRFKKGYSISSKLKFSLIKDRSYYDNPKWFDEIKSITKLEYSFYYDLYSQHVNPYVKYEAYLEARNNESQSTVLGIQYARDFSKYVNFTVDVFVDLHKHDKDTPTMTYTTLNPQINIYTSKHFEFILGYLYEKGSYEDEEYSLVSKMSKYNVEFNWLFDFK
ncbi:PEGA domain-containing protein [bacterium]|nr:PEGA domain-containing protein [bacterium]